MSCILESPTDPNIIEPCYNFVLQYMNRPELIENIFDALGECIQSSRRLKNLSLNNGVLEFSEKIAVSEDVNPLVRAQAVSFFRKLLDWEESLTYQHVTVEFLMAISNLLEYQIPQVQEITILAIIQLSLNCSIGMRILQAGIVTKLMGILSADLPYKVKISASLLSAALLCEENVNLAMKVYEATFDIAFELLLSSDHENWQMHALDSLLKFTATIEAHGLAQASQLTEKKWLVEIIDELVESQVPRVSDLARHLRETVFANVSE
ncbi:hypothetical protein GPJ56_003470 [Histomonas meleagridis]|uniref:uncharacterized protein n=1 Tax=Histomonas meleagridis TaxID=135588 RepID=UPI003559392E|nr:hypothetical protein GPJ56_003470 [Histomonas meleagridis]KAH0799162.1 hypothetical protein GO595_007959 [Histomonas meleagridis]